MVIISVIFIPFFPCNVRKSIFHSIARLLHLFIARLWAVAIETTGLLWKKKRTRKVPSGFSPCPRCEPQKRNAISRELRAAIPLTVSMRALGDDSRKTCSRRLTTKNGPCSALTGGTFWTAVWIASFLCLRSFHQQTPSAVWIFHFPHTMAPHFSWLRKQFLHKIEKSVFESPFCFVSRSSPSVRHRLGFVFIFTEKHLAC